MALSSASLLLAGFAFFAPTVAAAGTLRITSKFSGEHVYPHPDRSFNGKPNVIFPPYEYPITWQGADANYPVRIVWAINALTPDADGIIWDHNITAGNPNGTYAFVPMKALEEFPTPFAPNWTYIDAFSKASLQQWNFIGASQPDMPPKEGETEPYVFWSEQFILLEYRVEQSLAIQRASGRREEAEKWRLGVGVSVGLGIPVVMAVCWLMGRRSGKRETIPKTMLPEKGSI